MEVMTTTTLTFDFYVRATPDEVWRGLTDNAFVPRWRFGMSFETTWQAGGPLASRSPDGTGTVLDAAPGRRLSYDWEQSGAPEANGGHRSTVTFELTPMGEVTHLRTVHGDLETDGPFCGHRHRRLAHDPVQPEEPDRDRRAPRLPSGP
jgi:uncharacterized protein YndB with AHSA1/START domain